MLSTKNCVFRIHDCFHFSMITDQLVGIIEGHVTWSCALALAISYNFNFSIQKDCKTRAKCTKVNANCNFSTHYAYSSELSFSTDNELKMKILCCQVVSEFVIIM